MNTCRFRLFVPRDTTACSLGADRVAAELRRAIDDQQLPLDLVRNGSRGLYWLEPMLEIETDRGRVAFGPVFPDRLADFLAGKPWEQLASGIATLDHPLYLGLTEEIPYLKRQQRLSFSRVGITDPLNLDDYRSHGGLVALDKALRLKPQEIVELVKKAGLRGRGGAAFPTGIKWQTVLDTEATQKFIVCNADEGDSGTYSDRMLMESDPFCLIEGMLIAGLAVGAEQGYLYLREEYPLAKDVLEVALRRAYEAGILGGSVCASGKKFDLELRVAAGAYICGEETSLLESLEGKRGEVRAKPPLPAIKGLFGQPTVVNNVITLATVPAILAHGAESYRSYGTGRSRGTLPLQLAGNIKQAGLVELALGVPLRTLLQDFGGGSRSGRPLKAVQVGGPLGAYLPEEQWDTPLDYEAFIAIEAMLGHGGVVAFDDTVDMAQQARFAMEFCAIESCGKCTPCRIGSVRGVEVIDRIRAGQQADENIVLLNELCDTMAEGSLCAMGGLTPNPVKSALRHFPEDFRSPRAG
jgi:formate dehydrogenase iron-sulfur subunit